MVDSDRSSDVAHPARVIEARAEDAKPKVFDTFLALCVWAWLWVDRGEEYASIRPRPVHFRNLHSILSSR